MQLDDPYSIAGLYVAGKERLAADLGAGPINTWERPRLEFSMVPAFRAKRQATHEDEDLRWLQHLLDPSELRLAGAVDEGKLERYQGASEKLLAGFAMGGGSGQLNNGRPRFAEGLAINPGDPRLTALLSRLDEADKLLEAGAASGRLTGLQAKVKLGMRRFDQGRPAEALALFDEALLERPDDANLHYNRLLALRALNHDELDAQIADFQARFPADDRGPSLEGRQLVKAERFEEALACFETALALAPDSPVNRNNLAATLAALARYDEAGDAFAAVCMVSPEYPGAALSAAASYSMAGRTREAAEWMDFCLERGLAERRQFEELDFFANLRASEHWRER
jgi:tetratricopeptide (TPR) repeat protein